MTTCIAMMLQGRHRAKDGHYDTQALTNDAYEYAKPYLRYYQGELAPKLPYVPGAEEVYSYF